MRALALILFLAVAAAPLSAHGGEYRGPTTGTGARDNVPVPGTWQRWWETHREPLVREKTGPVAPVTGSDEFHLGTRREAPPAPPFAITADDRRDRIVPALLQLLASENHRDVQTACLMALAKIGLDGAGTTLESVFLPRLSRDDLEVRETAALALGIAGRAAAVAPLLALLLDEPDGRKLVGAGAVPDRMRAFAAYGLALLARRRGGAASRRCKNRSRRRSGRCCAPRRPARAICAPRACSGSARCAMRTGRRASDSPGRLSTSCWCGSARTSGRVRRSCRRRRRWRSRGCSGAATRRCTGAARRCWSAC
jgi:hypothetical protein